MTTCSTERPQGLSATHRFVKRGFDITASAVGLVLCGWIIALAYLIATIDTRQNGFYLQSRVGRWGTVFKIMKIRTMRAIPGHSTTVSSSRDPRITRVGRLLRVAKIDELPQLINVLRGDMSLVGPRPDVPGFADRLAGSDRVILSVRPGITGPATLHFRDEEILLASRDDQEKYNREVIFPTKIKLNRRYVEEYSFWKDIRYIYQTIFRSASPE
jgi:lipopolysaccharide/colanic/teichoic acid biosynthesis glycosyltransferase